MDPKQVFDNPDLEFLSSPDLECQYFERKRQRDADRLGDTVSAFSNKNKKGGLIVLGIEDDGKITGINTLGIQWYNNLQSHLSRIIQDSVYEMKLCTCQNCQGQEDSIVLIYVKFSENKLVEKTNGDAFIRIADETRRLNDEQKLELKYTKGQMDFEQICYEEYEESSFDKDILDQFLDGLKERDGVTANIDLDRVLLSKRIIQDCEGVKKLTSVGLLTLGKDPCEKIPGAKVRFIRYNGNFERHGTDMNIVKDQTFEGPLPLLISKTFEFIKTQMRDITYLGEDGKFIKEPEYPYTVVLEGIVNAVVHRSYSLKNSNIMIKMFDDKLIIESPGIFPGTVTPDNFYHYPRNPKTMQILQYFKYVKALNEGTKRMKADMLKSNLPPPKFREERDHVIVELNNNYEQRKQALKSPEGATSITQFSNFFKINVHKNDEKVRPSYLDDEFFINLRKEFVSLIIKQGWYIPGFKTNAYQLKNPLEEIKYGDKVIVNILPGFRFSFRNINNELGIILDPSILVKPRMNLGFLKEKNVKIRNIVGMSTFDRKNKISGRIIAINSEEVKISCRDKIFISTLNDCYPSFKGHHIQSILNQLNIRYNLDQQTKKYSLLTIPGAPKHRLKQTRELANIVNKIIDQLHINGHNLKMQNSPEKLVEPLFKLKSDLNETEISFDPMNKLKSDVVLNGITNYGSYEKPNKVINIVPVHTTAVKDKFNLLIEAISRGSFRYKGIERTFGVNFNRLEPIITQSTNEYKSEIQSYLSKKQLTECTIFLVYTPENEYSRHDYNSPYYLVKKILLENGFPSQMIDLSTLNDLRFKDLNLGLDIFAKCGYTPWVLAEGFPECDLFIGLSYSSILSSQGLSRILGYVNVFDKMGRWRYYKGNSDVFSFEERKEYFSQLVKETLLSLGKERNIKKIQIHHSHKLSREIKEEIYRKAVEAIPGIQIYFIWINTNTPIRLYDESYYSDGSLARGSYVSTSSDQFYLSTTGYNIFKQKVMGTPKILEVNIDQVPQTGDVDHRLIAQQILSLTKLNWASTKTFCHLPITLKYSKDIAYLMNAIHRGFGEFNLHSKLSLVPWFL